MLHQDWAEELDKIMCGGGLLLRLLLLTVC